MADYNTLVSEIVSRVMAEMQGTEKAADMLVPVGVSNRHIHLTQEHVEILFGKGYQLTPFKDLSQPGQYACKEQLTIIAFSPSDRRRSRSRSDKKVLSG